MTDTQEQLPENLIERRNAMADLLRRAADRVEGLTVTTLLDRDTLITMRLLAYTTIAAGELASSVAESPVDPTLRRLFAQAGRSELGHAWQLIVHEKHSHSGIDSIDTDDPSAYRPGERLAALLKAIDARTPRVEVE